jgi:CheY-like chemotaxis protein
VHPEAYKDPTWLSGDISTVQRKWAPQAADVTRYKNWHTLNDPAVAPMLRLQEASRGTAKDMQTKLLPLLAKAAARPASPQAAQAIEKSKRHWTEVQSILAKFGRNEIDPIQASRRIREKTGGKDIPQVVDEAAQMIESLGRHVGR